MREYVPYPMLEVEVAANPVYCWGAQRILERRLPGERPADPIEYAATVVVVPSAPPASEELRLA